MRCGVMVLGLLVSCGEAAAPAPMPEEFDDPFADEAAAAAKAVPEDRSAAEVDPAATGSVAVGGASGGAGVASAGAAGAAVNGSAGGGGDAPAPVASPGDGAGEGASAVAGAEAPAKKGAKKSAPAKPNAPEPVPEDSPPAAPAPAPIEPTPAPTPAPAPVQPAPPALAPEQRFVGSFKFVGGDAQRQNLDAAIEAAAMELNALIRGIGRKRLRESNPIRDQVTIAVDGDKVSMTSVAGRTLVHRLGGPAVPWTSDSGKAVQVSVSLVKGRLVQTYTADDGGRRSTWTLDETGDKLTLSVTVTSERLANPLKYALSYRRI